MNQEVVMNQVVIFETDDPRVQGLLEALNRLWGEDQKRIADVGVHWIDMILRKNRDYGGSAWEVPVLLPDMDIGTAILARMSDKIARLRTLRTLAREKGRRDAPMVKDETLEDTIADLGAYCLLYLARPVYLARPGQNDQSECPGDARPDCSECGVNSE